MIIYNRKTWSIIRGLLFFILAGAFVYRIRSVFTPFILAFVIAYLLHPLVDLLEKKKVPRVWGIMIIYLAFMMMMTALLIFGIPALIRELNNLMDQIPAYTASIEDMLETLQTRYNRVPLPESIREVGNGVIARMEAVLLGFVQGIADGIIALLSQSFNLVLAPLLSFYFLLDYKRLGPVLLGLVPARYKAATVRIVDEINQVIKKIIRGNMLVALLVAVMATLGMLLVGMDFPLLIGIMVGVTNFIPYYGAIISAVPVVLLALLKSKWLALYVLGVMIVIQQIEGNIISPKILGGCVGLHPLVIIFALLAGGELWGITGMLLAVPTAAVCKVLLTHAYKQLI